MTFDEFCRHIAEELHLDLSQARRDVHIVDDLMLDSLEMMELSVVMYELGAEVPEELAPVLVTLGDWYEHYLTRVNPDPIRADLLQPRYDRPINLERNRGWTSPPHDRTKSFRSSKGNA